MKRKFMFKEGKQMAVIRPDDPALALRLAHEQVEIDRAQNRSAEESKAAFDALLNKQEYRFVGLASSDGKRLLDLKGWSIGKIKAGDSFCDFDQLVLANQDKLTKKETPS